MQKYGSNYAVGFVFSGVCAQVLFLNLGLMLQEEDRRALTATTTPNDLQIAYLLPETWLDPFE